MIHLITPCLRPQNLVRILDSIRRELQGLDWAWWTIVDGRTVQERVPTLDERQRIIGGYPPKDVFGAGFLRNIALRSVERGWVYDLDDDTILHPNFRSLLNRAEGKKAFFFDQVDKHQVRICGPEGPYGTGMGAIQKSAIVQEWLPDRYDTDQDYFGAHMKAIPQEQQIRFSEPGAYYNFLR